MSPRRHPFGEMRRVGGCVDSDVGGYHHLVANRYAAVVEKSAVHVDDDFIAETDVDAILTAEVDVYIDIVADAAEHLFVNLQFGIAVGIVGFA